jgi:hypothetical protein
MASPLPHGLRVLRDHPDVEVANAILLADAVRHGSSTLACKRLRLCGGVLAQCRIIPREQFLPAAEGEPGASPQCVKSGRSVEGRRRRARRRRSPPIAAFQMAFAVPARRHGGNQVSESLCLMNVWHAVLVGSVRACRARTSRRRKITTAPAVPPPPSPPLIAAPLASRSLRSRARRWAHHPCFLECTLCEARGKCLAGAPRAHSISRRSSPR